MFTTIVPVCSHVISTPWAVKKEPNYLFVSNFVKDQWILMPFALLDLNWMKRDDMNFTHLPKLMFLHYLVKLETPKMLYDSVIFITKVNCIRCIIASLKWTSVMCHIIYLFGVLCSNACTKQIWHLWPARTLDANLVRLWTGRYQRCSWPVAWPSDVMCACWRAGIHFEHMLSEMNVHLWNCQCNLMHLALNLCFQSFNFYRVV